MKFRNRYYLLPMPIIELVFKNGLHAQFKLYLYLKASSDGHIKNLDKTALAKRLKVSRTTLDKHLNQLQARNWIGYNEKRNIWHIRSFSTLLLIEKLKGRTGVWFKVTDFDKFTQFIDSSVVSEQVRKEKVKHFGKAQQKGSAFQLPKYFAISLRYLGSRYDISHMTIQRRIKRAIKCNYIMHKKGENVKIGKHGQAFLKGYPELTDNVYYKNGTYWLRSSDQYQTNLLFKRRRKPCLQS